MCKAADALKQFGARRVVAYATHPVLSGKALENLKNSVLDELVVTDTIPLSQEALELGKIRQVSVAGMVAETIRRINNEESISAMFDSYL
ncbi:Ribose-phosphate pyrophosphokinase [compost metagenome]